ncbi:MAG: hypothetical protein V4616_13995 [Bacteroidota bacterium]
MSALIATTGLGCWLFFLAKQSFTAECVLAQWGIGWLLVTILWRLALGICATALIYRLIKPASDFLFIPLLSFILLVFMTESILGFPTGRDLNNWISPVFFNVFSRITIYLLVAAGFAFTISSGRWLKKDVNGFYLRIGIFAAAIVLCFLIKPVYYQDFTNLEQEFPTGLNKQIKRAGFDSNEPGYLFYFDSGCPHCYLLYHQIVASKKQLPENIQLKAVFQGNAEQVSQFTNGRKITIPHTLLADTSFFHECGPQLPAVFTLENNNVKHYRIGDQFNYLQLSKICD